jgi:channel protein (hemolysin III family)
MALSLATRRTKRLRKRSKLSVLTAHKMSPSDTDWYFHHVSFAYMAGVAFFATDSRLRYGHFIWHLFVLTGTGCRFFAVLGYAT